MGLMLPKTILVTSPENIRYHSGFVGTFGYLLLQNKKGYLFTDSRYTLVAQSLLKKNCRLVPIGRDFSEAWQDKLARLHAKKIAFEGVHMSVQALARFKKISKGVQFMDVGAALDEERMVKSGDELHLISQAQRITDMIFRDLKKTIRRGMSEKQIAWDIECFAKYLGADDISFEPIVGINENSASPHHQCTDKRVQKGDMILIDMGVKYQGYCSDMTRVLFTKQPTNAQRSVYEKVLEAQQTAIAKIRAGVRGADIDAVARGIIEASGFGREFGHSLGHGVGLAVHELPNLASTYTGKLHANCVVTIEPGIYLPGKFGVRIEDMAVVKKNGCEVLTKSPRSMQESIIGLK